MHRQRTRSSIPWVVVSLLLVLLISTVVVYHHHQKHLSLAQRALTIESQLRAPGDPATVAESPLGVAQNMKYQVSQLLKKGLTNQQVLTDMEQAYGSSVLAAPKFSGFGSIAWIAPWFVLALIGSGVLIFLRKTTLFGVNKSAPTADIIGSSLPQTDAQVSAGVEEKLKDYL
jgi:cytochrome c-type biogenesis protein CcmH/NrfF